MNSLLLLTPPATEPLTLAEARAHLRVDSTADDTLITSLIAAVRQACENITARALITQTWRLWIDGGSALLNNRSLNLPKSPLISVSAVSSFDETGAETVFSAANYYIDAAGTPGRVVLKDFAGWPAVLRRVAAIKVDFTCGYGAASDVPADLKQGMLQHLAQLYQNRGDAPAILPASALALYQPYRILKVV